MTRRTKHRWPFAHVATPFLLFAIGAFSTEGLASSTSLEAPNVVVISSRLVTSGQPTRVSLARLNEQGFGAVIYLAPPTVADAVPEEADILRKQGIEFVNIPIKFGSPSSADFAEFVKVMQKFRDRKILVHCQVNMRASTMTFLYRVIVGNQQADLAYDAVARVWSPEGPWKQLIVTELKKAKIEFVPY
jgi:protein tyrosine phosphatase (PTP) superfamily phosphohydrolase (DUF442 family)